MEAALEMLEEIKKLDKRDKQFAKRLKNRDESVLADIEDVYRSPLLSLLEHKIQQHDAELVFNLMLSNLWEDFDSDRGSVRGFLNGVAYRRMVDVLRQKGTQRDLVAKILENAVEENLHHPRQPADALISREEQAAVSVMLSEVLNAVEKLTPLQQRAFKSRFLNNPEKKWAIKLEKETGIPAKQWRKHSDSALRRVRKIVAKSIQKEAS